jgi:ABC-2 type transport system ATP-binding protein/sodium transport system ATP-binding protein
MIEVHRLTKRFRVPGGRVLTAVDGISFEVRQGQVYGLLGPNGAGKTTTLRLILGLLEPSEGYASIAGIRSTIEPDEVKRRVGIVSSSGGVYQWQSVRQMLLFFADLYGLSPDVAGVRLRELSELLGISAILEQRCITLSTGQKQRVNLARALIHDPQVMLLDEPTLGLDVLGTQAVNEYIQLLRSRGKAVILCTHHLDEAERMCDRFGLLHRGQIVAEGTLAELRARTGCCSLVEMFMQLSQIGPALSTRVASERSA